MANSPPLIVTHPELVEELIDPLPGEFLTRGSDQKVWWRCSLNHPYEASVANRVQGRSCPFCRTGPFLADLASRNIRLARVILKQIRDQSHVLVGSDLAKYCVRCFEIKRLSHFYKSAKAKDGHKPYCKECGKAYSLQWIRENQEENQRKAALWYEANKLQALAGAKAYAAKHPERTRSAKRKYSRTHPEVGRSAVHRRRARIRGAITEKFLDEEIYERDNWICQLCGEAIDSKAEKSSSRKKSLDHIVPISKGGSHTRDNVQAAHLDCNIRKGNKT